MNLEWTGERFLPGVGFDIAYEHYGRYAMAQPLVKGRSVLDIPSGEGYGSFMLSKEAADVVGVDISEESVVHAQRKYSRPNLRFLRGNMAQLAFARDSQFDVITCFEGIEHVSEEDQRKALKEFRRVLKTDGFLVISSPNKATYSDKVNYHNPFHLKEFYTEEFLSFLRSEFRHVSCFGQNLVDAAVISSLSPGDSMNAMTVSFFEGATENSDALLPRVTDPDRFMYFIAVCSSQPIPEVQSDRGHVVVDLRRQAFQELLKIAGTQKISYEQEKNQLNERIHALECQVFALKTELGHDLYRVARLLKRTLCIPWFVSHIVLPVYRRFRRKSRIN